MTHNTVLLFLKPSCFTINNIAFLHEFVEYYKKKKGAAWQSPWGKGRAHGRSGEERRLLGIGLPLLVTPSTAVDAVLGDML